MKELIILITIMSYNLRIDIPSDGINAWEHRAQASSIMVEDQKPDLLALQEAKEAQVKFLANNTRNYKVIGLGKDRGAGIGDHMAILYNKKSVGLIKWGSFWLSETPNEYSLGWGASYPRMATWALCKNKASGRRFYFVNTHLDHESAQARSKGLELILNMMDSINKDGLPVVIAGDFNVEPDDSCLTILEGKMQSARATAITTDNGITYNAWGNGRGSVIDHIYFTGFKECKVFGAVRDAYGKREYISDHYPIKATFMF